MKSRADYNRKYYLKYRLSEHGSKVRSDNRTKVRTKFRLWLHALKNKPCMSCDRCFPPVCMDFDHRDPKTKSFSVSQGWSRSKERVLEEIAKCDLVCANCHRIRTHKE